MYLDDCFLSEYYLCEFIIWAIAFLLFSIPGFVFTVCHYIWLVKFRHRKQKRNSVSLDNELELQVQGQKTRRRRDSYYVCQRLDAASLSTRLFKVLTISFLLSILVFTICKCIMWYRAAFVLCGRPNSIQLMDSHLLEKACLKFQLQQALSSTLSADRSDILQTTISPHRILNVTMRPNDTTKIMKEQVTEPKAAALQTLVLSEILAAEMKLNESMAMFQQLVGYKVQYYISQKLSTFRLTGNLNFWKYFQHQSQHQNTSYLRKSIPLEEGQTIEDVFFLSDINPVRLSADNQFLLYDSLINGPDFEQLTENHKVTIATQTSMDRLFTFIESYEHWAGPISVAVFLKGPLEYFLLKSYLLYLKLCHPKHYRQTRFSIATPVKNPIPRNILIETNTFDEFDCKSRSDDIYPVFKKGLDETNAWLKEKYYPQNMMRNLAKANIKTDYHLTLDVDIVPCVGMSEKLNNFLKESFITSALVIPTYEISRKISFPKTKRELVSLTKKKLAQPFHKDIFATNQNATNFPKWEKVYDSFEEVHVVHEVQIFPLLYEPFFVELHSNPLFDETFVGYGFTRSSHAFEVFVRNGKFLVLSPIFTAELGIKKVKDWSSLRQQQNESNRKRFNYFIANITSQFPNVQKLENDSSTSYYLHNSNTTYNKNHSH